MKGTRFRYASREGVEVEVRDLDGLRAHVAHGRVRDDTPLHDALTGEKGPASSHEAYRFVLEFSSEDRAGAAGRVSRKATGGQPRDRGEPAAASNLPPDLRERDFLGMEITLTEPPVPDRTAEVVERLRKERAEEDERHSTGERPAPVLVDGASGTISLGEPPEGALGTWGDTGEVTPMSDEVAQDDAWARDAADAGAAGVPSGEPGSDGVREDGSSRRRAAEQLGRLGRSTPRGRGRSRPERLRRGPRWSGRFVSARLGGDGNFYTIGLLVVLVASAAHLTVEARTGTSGGEVPTRVAGAAEVEAHLDLAPRGAANRLADSEGIAFQHMVEGMDSLARVHRVFNVPAVWLEGRYLANAAAHTEVEEYWRRYLDFVGDLRNEDVALFRRSFVSRMESLDVSQAVVSLRLAQALRRFDESQPLREEMYDHMEDLARAGLELHDLMVRRAVDVRYTPASQVSAVRDPFLEVYIEDEELQGRIYGILDRILADLEALHGETRWTRDRLNHGVLQSIRATGDRGADSAP